VSVMCQSYDKSQVYSGDVNGCLVVSEFEGASFGQGKSRNEGKNFDN